MSARVSGMAVEVITSIVNGVEVRHVPSEDEVCSAELVFGVGARDEDLHEQGVRYAHLGIGERWIRGRMAAKGHAHHLRLQCLSHMTRHVLARSQALETRRCRARHHEDRHGRGQRGAR